jgi:hypothetical protein
MNRKTLIMAASSCLALLLVVCPADAQRGGRGGGGGGWGGGGRGGWGGGGYYGGGWGGRGYYGGGWGRGYYGGGIYLGSGYGGYYGDGYYYPGYYDNGVVIDGSPIYYSQPMAGPVMTSDPTGLPANGTVAQANGVVGRQAFYSGPAGSQAVVKVKTAGPDAQVWINGTPMGTSQSGEQVFTFHSPTPGSVYTIREAWNENGKQMTREKQVTLQPGQTIVADLAKADTNQPQGNNATEQLQNTQNNEQQNGQRQDSATQPPANPIPKPAIPPLNNDAKPKSEVK